MTQIRNVGPSPSPPIVAESDSDPGRHRPPRIASRRCQGRTRPPSDATCPGRTSWRASGKPHPHPPPLRPAVACNPAPQRLFGWRRWSQCRGRSRPAELPFGGAGDAIGLGIKTVAGAPRRFWCAVRPFSTPGALAHRSVRAPSAHKRPLFLLATRGLGPASSESLLISLRGQLGPPGLGGLPPL